MEVAKRCAELRAAKAIVAREELSHLRAVLGDAVADAQAAESELCALSVAIEQELSPARSLCEKLGVTDALITLKRLSSRRFLLAEQKTEFDAACRTLRGANDQVRARLHVSLPALVELVDASYNRLDKVRDSFVRYENVYRGVVPCAAA